MKEPIYKAKTRKDGKWYEGNYFRLHEDEEILHCLAYNAMWNCTDGGISEIDDYVIQPETLCEFTGLLDSFGNRVYLNDVLSVRFEYDSEMRDYPPDYVYESGIVGFDDSEMRYIIRFVSDNNQYEEVIPLSEITDCEICVIENIFDTKED